MNTLEAEYSFLAPTWRLPTVATPSIFPHTLATTYLPSDSHSGPDWTLWNNTMYNSRYIPAYVPSTSVRRNNYPIPINYQRVAPIIGSQNYQKNLDRSLPTGIPYPSVNNQHGLTGSIEDGLNLTISLHPNNDNDVRHDNTNYPTPRNHMANRGLTYAANNQNNHSVSNQKRRVQIVDHNRQSPATTIIDNMSERNSRNSNHAATYAHYSRTPDSHKAQQRKSKTPSSNHHLDHSDETKHGHDNNNVTIHDYLYGLSAPDPGSYATAYKQHQRRLQEEKLGRKSVVNEYRTFAKDYGFGPSFGNAHSVTNEEKVDTEHRRKTYSRVVKETNHHKLEEQKRFQSTNGQQRTRPAPVPKYQRAREYAEKIEKPQHQKPVFQTEFSPWTPIVSPIIPQSQSKIRRHSILSSLQYSKKKRKDFLASDFDIHRTRRSLSLPTIIRTGNRLFNNRNLSRCSSNASIRIGSPTRSLSLSLTTRKLISKVLREKNDKQKKNSEKSSNISLLSTSNETKTKSIISHSMMTKNMRLPPTATVIINQTYKPSLAVTTSTNNNFKKPMRNKNHRTPSQHRFYNQFQKTSTNKNLNFDLEIIKSFHHTNDKNSSNE
ncbi:unnamed protein product [Rotaria magnacalcarata]|uniref:Uncharacterized protein n=2 Tax=Rotaria magnacalcarata TaxID=392030 RepID=A0A816YP09_9BILA|nr:unnamed protein product [Rotaria magnacalcarata]CAF3899938.1 unnamed protein product [Rotaria magnacalcarata]